MSGTEKIEYGMSASITSGVAYWAEETSDLLAVLAVRMQERARHEVLIPHAQAAQAAAIVDACKAVWRAKYMLDEACGVRPPLAQRLAEARNHKSEE